MCRASCLDIEFGDIEDNRCPPTSFCPSGRHKDCKTSSKVPTGSLRREKAYEAAGVKMKDFYMVTGQYDMIAILDAPDDVTLAKAMLSSAPHGSITMKTCRAFMEHEYRNIIGGLD